MQALLNEILDAVRPLIGQGKVADYIPALGTVPANQLGIAVYGNDGEMYCAGDAETPFSVQSISKVFSLVQAIEHSGEAIWERLGHEPSGQPFNSLVQLEFERGRPRNPFINAGALVICDINQSRFAAPTLSMRDFVRRLSGNPQIMIDGKVADSEYQHRARNAAMAYLMQSFGNFHNDVEAVLRSYFSHCALRMNCIDLARAFCFLANDGFANTAASRFLCGGRLSRSTRSWPPVGYMTRRAILLIAWVCRARAASVAGLSRWCRGNSPCACGRRS